MALQVQTVYDEFKAYKHDVSDVATSLFCTWADWLNKWTYRYFIGIDPERFITTTTFTVSGTPSTPYSASLPADYKTMQPFGCGLFLVSNGSTNTSQQLAQTGFGSMQAGFYITGSTIVFTGITNATYIMRYIPTITTIDAFTDYFTNTTASNGKEVIMPEYDQFAVKALDVFYSQWDEDIPMEGIADARFARIMSETGMDVRRTGGIYSTDDFSIIF